MEWSRAGLTACLTCSTHGVLRALCTSSMDPGKPTWTSGLKQIRCVFFKRTNISFVSLDLYCFYRVVRRLKFPAVVVHFKIEKRI